MRPRYNDSGEPYLWVQRSVLDVGLSASAFMVYCVLADFADENDRCWPSEETIGNRIGKSRSTVVRALRELKSRELVRVTPRFNGNEPTSNLYELLPVPSSDNDQSAGRGVTSDMTLLSPVTRPSCHQWRTNKDQSNKEKGKEEYPPPSVDDPLLGHFRQGFRQRYGHVPNIGSRQLFRWRSLKQAVAENIIRAKIDGWWDHPLPSNFTGNRTFGAFLQWFDDIVIRPPDAAAAKVLSDDDLLAAMHNGSLEGKVQFRELVGDLAPDAQIRTLIHQRFAKDEDDAKRIINACS